MWLVLDIGNSAAKGGLFDGSRLEHTFRLEGLPRSGTVPNWETALQEALGGCRPVRAGITSVVPAATQAAQAAIRRETGLTAEVVHHRMHLPFSLAYETPHTLGTDRLAAAAAAWAQFSGGAGRASKGVVVVDAGTAVTFEVIDRTGVYHGGVIAPGPTLLLRALNEGTAQLPPVPLALPERAVGRSTREALQAGLMYAFLDGVGGMLARIRSELEEEPVVVVTGGWGAFLHEHLAPVHHLQPDLVLHGIRLLLEMNPE